MKTSTKKDALKKLREFYQDSMLSAIGIEVTDFGDDFVSGKMPVDHRTIQTYGLLHGGASAALAESLGSIAAGIQIDRNAKSVVGIELNINHLKSVKSGWVFGKATPVKIGKRIQVWDIHIRDENNVPVSVSRLTLAVIDKKN